MSQDKAIQAIDSVLGLYAQKAYPHGLNELEIRDELEAANIKIADWDLNEMLLQLRIDGYLRTYKKPYVYKGVALAHGQLALYYVKTFKGSLFLENGGYAGVRREADEKARKENRLEYWNKRHLKLMRAIAAGAAFFAFIQCMIASLNFFSEDARRPLEAISAITCFMMISIGVALTSVAILLLRQVRSKT